MILFYKWLTIKKMRDHKFADKVVQAMLAYNNNLYIDDINEIINNNTYGDVASTYLTAIVSMLNNIINVNNNVNPNTNVNYFLPIYINTLKTYIFRILDLNNGSAILKKIICEDE